MKEAEVRTSPNGAAVVQAEPSIPAKTEGKTLRSFDAIEVYKLYRSRIEQQSGLLAQRASLVIPLQSALLLAWSWFAFGTVQTVDPAQFVRFVIPVMAVAQLCWAFRAAHACRAAIDNLVTDFSRLDEAAEDKGFQFIDKNGVAIEMKQLFGDPEDPSRSLLFPIVSARKVHAAGHQGGLAIIIILGAIWIVAFGLLWVPR